MGLVIFPKNIKAIINPNVIKELINLFLLWCLSYCIKISDIVNSIASTINAIIKVISFRIFGYYNLSTTSIPSISKPCLIVFALKLANNRRLIFCSSFTPSLSIGFSS